MPPSSHASHRGRLAVAGAALSGVLLSGCGPQSILTTHSRPAHNIMLLWWWMLAAATVVFAGAATMLVLAWRRRGTPGLPLIGEHERASEGMVVVFGIAVPLVVLSVLFGVSNVYLIKQTAPPANGVAPMQIDVTGHQFWWEVRYHGSRAVTANEIHIPVNTEVEVLTRSADVIHSFWVPGLNRKVDMIPGHVNRVILDAQQAGRFRGQCSQFCGPQHANMAMVVVAQPRAQFDAWLANTAAPAVAAAPGSAAAGGEQRFLASQCASCHRIAGTSAAGLIGPDLSHLADRRTLASLTIPNTPRELAAWITNPQAIKPGALMPDLGLSRTDVSRIVAYLETLR